MRCDTSEFRERLDGKRLFLSGGTGFFGKWLLATLRASGAEAEVTVLSRDPKRFLAACPEFDHWRNLRFIAGDVRSFPFPPGTFDLVIHAATDASAKLLAEQPEEMYDVIVSGTRRMLAFAETAQAERFLFTSSGAVYGVQPPELEGIPESFPCHPVTAYGRGKLEAEQLCIASGLPVLLPRCFAFVGPYLNLGIHFAIGNFLRDGLRGGPIVVQGDGRPFRSWLYAGELAEWLWTILFQGVSGRPYNVGSPESFSIAEAADLTASCFEPVPHVEIRGKRSDGPAPRYVPDVTRAREELGLAAAVPLREALRRTIAFHRNRGAVTSPPAPGSSTY